MRRPQPKPKDRRKVPIPAQLRDSLREVFELIEQAKNDPDIALDYGDAIQVGAVCGGRYGPESRPYVLAYYPETDPERGRWFLNLHGTEIEDIADGRMAEITLYCCTSLECRCKFRDSEDRCSFCDYVDDPDYGTFSFPDAVTKLAQRGVSGLSEHSTRDDVVAALGPPDTAGGDARSPALGYIRPWITYRRADCQLRFEFQKKSKRIRNVTVMDKDWQPGK